MPEGPPGRNDISLLELEKRPFVIKPKSQGSSIGGILFTQKTIISPF